MEEEKPKGVAILGSSGSIGTQALEVIAAHADKFVVEVLTVNRNAKLLIELSRTCSIAMGNGIRHQTTSNFKREKIIF